MILIELTAALNLTGELKTFYVSTDRFVSSPYDTPPNVAFENTVTDPGNVTVRVFSDGQTAGGTQLDTGEIVLANQDGRYDGWLNFGFDGRPVIIRYGTAGNAYPNGFTTIFTGTVANVFADKKELRIRVKDKQHTLDRQFLTTTYQGTNSGATGVEGLATDIKGNVKPRVYGACFNVTPILVNTSKLTYQVSDSSLYSLLKVYDNAVALTTGTDYATLTLLTAATVTSGTYATCLAAGYFRLGSTPAGQITCDPVAGATSSVRTTAQILKAMAMDAGVSLADLDSASVTALDAANGAEVGLYVDDTRTVIAAMDEVAQSVGAYYGFNPAGKMIMGVWAAPTGTPKASIVESQIGKDYQRRPARDNAIPVWSVSLGYQKFCTTQASGLAGSVTADRKQALALEYRKLVTSDSAVKLQYLLATSMEVNTLLIDATAAAVESARVLALHKVQRECYEVAVPVQLIATAGLGLGDVVTLTLDRFGLGSGKLMRVQGIALELARNRATLILWG